MENKEQEDKEIQQSFHQKDQLTFCFQGKVQGNAVKILVDTGAQETFIAEDFVKGNKLPTKKVAPIELRMAEGNISESCCTTKTMTFTIMQDAAPSWAFKERLRLAILNSGYGYSLENDGYELMGLAYALSRRLCS